MPKCECLHWRLLEHAHFRCMAIYVRLTNCMQKLPYKETHNKVGSVLLMIHSSHSSNFKLISSIKCNLVCNMSKLNSIKSS